jgi:hypothetical protein
MISQTMLNYALHPVDVRLRTPSIYKACFKGCARTAICRRRPYRSATSVASYLTEFSRVVAQVIARVVQGQRGGSRLAVAESDLICGPQSLT